MKPISCKEAITFILKKEEGRLSLWNRLKLWRHLAICSLCRIFLSQNKLINKFVRKQNSQHQLSEAEKERIVNHVLTDEGNEKNV